MNKYLQTKNYAKAVLTMSFIFAFSYIIFLGAIITIITLLPTDIFILLLESFFTREKIINPNYAMTKHILQILMIVFGSISLFLYIVTFGFKIKILKNIWIVGKMETIKTFLILSFFINFLGIVGTILLIKNQFI